jgi:Ni/Co efflux regulator RcnB
MNRPPPPPFVAGRRMPPEYLGYNYRVEQWQRYNLPRPRPGYYWVQYGADFVMVSPAGIGIQIFIH